MTTIVKRIGDVVGSAVALLVCAVPMCCIALLIRWTSSGPALYWSNRVGRGNNIFRMPKFRTMFMDTPAVATHLLAHPEQHVTPFGRVLRRWSIDELPQLISVLKGDMSFVGPRPALYNQDDLIRFRTERGVHQLVPGITGWAQIHGRDTLSIPEKVEYDAYYLAHRSLALDGRIILETIVQAIRGEGVSH